MDSASVAGGALPAVAGSGAGPAVSAGICVVLAVLDGLGFCGCTKESEVDVALVSRTVAVG